MWFVDIRPVLHLPGPSKATVAVRCCPVLFELRKSPVEEGRDLSFWLVSFWFAQWVILGWMEWQLYSCGHASVLSPVGPPNYTTWKGPDNPHDEMQRLMFYPRRNHPSCKSKAPFYLYTSKNPCYAQATWDWICLKKKKQNKTKQNKKKQNKTKTNKQTN